MVRVTQRIDYRKVTVSLPGGDLVTEWREGDGHVLMTGPYALDFEGTLLPELLGSGDVVLVKGSRAMGLEIWEPFPGRAPICARGALIVSPTDRLGSRRPSQERARS